MVSPEFACLARLHFLPTLPTHPSLRTHMGETAAAGMAPCVTARATAQSLIAQIPIGPSARSSYVFRNRRGIEISVAGLVRPRYRYFGAAPSSSASFRSFALAAHDILLVAMSAFPSYG